MSLWNTKICLQCFRLFVLSRVIFQITYVNDLGLFKDTSDMVTGFFNFEFCSKITQFTIMMILVIWLLTMSRIQESNLISNSFSPPTMKINYTVICSVVLQWWWRIRWGRWTRRLVWRMIYMWGLCQYSDSYGGLKISFRNPDEITDIMVGFIDNNGQ